MSTYRGAGTTSSGSTYQTTADSVANTPSGDISATNVQDAIDELDSDKPSYEEGTFTPVYSDGTNNASTYSTQVGYYTKIGRLVTFQFTIRPTNIGSVSGNIRITGLPYTSKSGITQACAVGYCTGLVITASESLNASVTTNSTDCFIYVFSETTGNAIATETEFPVNSQISVAGSYIV